MADETDHDIAKAVASGDERAFERAYDAYRQRVRLVAFRISHRPDWAADIENEAWCRAFRQRREFPSAVPFLVWMAGIVRNVYREFCRDSRLVLSGTPEAEIAKIDKVSPEIIAHEAEVLTALNDCLSSLSPQDSRIVRRRFFENVTLRELAQELTIPEATLREKVLVKLLNQLRACLARKKIDFSEIFSAQDPTETQ